MHQIFYNQLEFSQSDVVYGVQKSRKGSLLERLGGVCFYRLFKFLSGYEIPENLVTARLMSRRYVNSLVLHEEREVLIAGLWHVTGYKQEQQLITKRNTSKTSYTLGHKISFIINSITSFSNKPLVATFYLGIVIFIMSSIYILYTTFCWFFISLPVSGWTSLIASIGFLGGLNISFLGLIGIYLSKIYSETKKRPYTIVREKYGKN